MTFWLQTKAPAGNWVDNLGADKQSCIDHGNRMIEERICRPDEVRVIERVDTEVWNPQRLLP